MNMKIVILTILLCLQIIAASQESNLEKISEPKTVYENFNKGTQTEIARRLLSLQHISLIQNAGPDGSDAIRVAYVGDECGSLRSNATIPLGFSTQAATLSFDVCFHKDFKWVKGGKLHGLGPRRPITGGQQRLPDGWSARIMFQKNGACSTYLYDQDKTKKYGVGKNSKQPTFFANQWHHVALELKLNTPGKPNGSARIMVDNKEVANSQGVVFREVGGPNTDIQQFLFSTFHGGHMPDWAPVDEKGNYTTEYAYFDNILITDDNQKHSAHETTKIMSER